MSARKKLVLAAVMIFAFGQRSEGQDDASVFRKIANKDPALRSKAVAELARTHRDTVGALLRIVGDNVGQGDPKIAKSAILALSHLRAADASGLFAMWLSLEVKEKRHRLGTKLSPYPCAMGLATIGLPGVKAVTEMVPYYRRAIELKLSALVFKKALGLSLAKHYVQSRIDVAKNKAIEGQFKTILGHLAE